MAIDPQVRARLLAQLGAAHAQAYPKTLEQHYPHVLEKIAGITSPVDAERVFDNLMLTQRSDRQGFPVEAFGELLTLVNVFRQIGLLREPPKKDGDVWAWVSDVGVEKDQSDHA